MAASGFDSVVSHGHWVYCAYILFEVLSPGLLCDLKVLGDKQRQLQQYLEHREKHRILQMLIQIGGVQGFKEEL